MCWNRDHTVHWSSLFLLLVWENERTGDKVWSIGLQVLVEDDLVHGLGELKVDLAQEGGGIRRALTSELLGILSHAEDSVDFLVVDLWDLVSRHVLNVEVVFEE